MRCFGLLCCTLLLSLALPAQTFRASILAGGSLSQVDGDDLLGFHQPGLFAGVRVWANLGPHWRVGPELNFTQFGAKRNRNSLNISEFSRIDLQAIEVPVLVAYKDWRFTAEAGVAFQRLTDYRVYDAAGTEVTSDYRLRDNLGALILGATLYLSPKWGVGFRWSRHFTDLQQAAEPRWRGRTLSLRAVYVLGSGETLPDSGTVAPASSPNE